MLRRGNALRLNLVPKFVCNAQSPSLRLDSVKPLEVGVFVSTVYVEIFDFSTKCLLGIAPEQRGYIKVRRKSSRI